jgi:hypothetical protein
LTERYVVESNPFVIVIVFPEKGIPFRWRGPVAGKWIKRFVVPHACFVVDSRFTAFWFVALTPWLPKTVISTDVLSLSRLTGLLRHRDLTSGVSMRL